MRSTASAWARHFRVLDHSGVNAWQTPYHGERVWDLVGPLETPTRQRARTSWNTIRSANPTNTSPRTLDATGSNLSLGLKARRTDPAPHATPTFTVITMIVRIPPSTAICNGTSSAGAVAN